MLFKKPLEEFYRDKLYKSVSNCPDYQVYSPLDADRYIAMSLLQKAIRRGEFGFAFSSAITLLNHNDRDFLETDVCDLFRRHRDCQYRFGWAG